MYGACSDDVIEGSGTTDLTSTTSSSTTSDMTTNPTTNPTTETSGTDTEGMTSVGPTSSSSSTTSDTTTTGPDTTTSTTGPDTTGTTGVDPSVCCFVGEGPGCGDADVEACVCAEAPECCDGEWGDKCVIAVSEQMCAECPLPPGGDCCEANGSPDCDEPDIAACVCDVAPSCCEDEWTDACAALVDALGCGMCDGGGGNPCCEVQDGPGCMEDGDIEPCVCEQLPGCCDDVWDQGCVDAVEQLGCGMCDGGMMPNVCCEPMMGPGCPDPDVEMCVCEMDPFCCENQWDELCADEVEQFGCGMCGGGMMNESCCEPHESPGCESDDISMCVCEQDPFCCQVEWDQQCVDEVEMFGCGMCM